MLYNGAILLSLKDFLSTSLIMSPQSLKRCAKREGFLMLLKKHSTPLTNNVSFSPTLCFIVC